MYRIILATDSDCSCEEVALVQRWVRDIRRDTYWSDRGEAYSSGGTLNDSRLCPYVRENSSSFIETC